MDPDLFHGRVIGCGAGGEEEGGGEEEWNYEDEGFLAERHFFLLFS
jgi:hypothetical protein